MIRDRRHGLPEKKTKVQTPTGLVDATEVPVSESTERWTDVRLEDGSVIRLKAVVIGAARIDGQYDNDGNPLYTVKVNQVMVVASAPDHLRKGGSGALKGVH
jgi:hypothetical protein